MHWTYRSVPSEKDLEQGDILDFDDNLRKLFGEVHSYFLTRDRNYLGFLVLTQTCDLVRRGAERTCKSRYVTVAAYRSLASSLFDLLDHECEKVCPGVYAKESKANADMMLKRLINQNEEALGLFYLHPDADVGIGEPCIAFLQVAVAFRIEHYDRLILSRRGGLEPAFQAKLGWLVGNLFSRIGTPDWYGSKERSEELKKMVKGILAESPEDPAQPNWVTKEAKESLGKAGLKIEDVSRENMRAVLEKYKPPSAIDKVVSAVLGVLKETALAREEGAIDNVAKRLKHDLAFVSSVKRSAKEAEGMVQKLNDGP